MRFYIFLILLIASLVSCNVSSFLNKNGKFISSNHLLGVVGEFESGQFVEAGVPKLEANIRLSVQKIAFTKKSLKRYNKKILQKDQKLEIIDSLDFRPFFYKLEIADKIGLINALNHSENSDIKTFLKTTQGNLIVTSLNMYFPMEVSALIDQASDVYVINNKQSSYSLELLNKDRSRTIVDFKEGTSFDYDFSAFCWRKNNRHQPEIAAFRKKGRPCPGETEKSPQKLKSEDMFEKM